MEKDKYTPKDFVEGVKEIGRLVVEDLSHLINPEDAEVIQLHATIEPEDAA